MRSRALKQAGLAAIQIIAVIVSLSAPLRAEATRPTPTPAPAPTTPPTASFSQALASMASRASDLLPVIRNEIEGPLLPWLERTSLLLAGLVMIAAFARLWRENAGAGADLFWWFARLGVIFALVGSGPKIIDGMFVVGREIAVGTDGSSPLFQFYVKQRGNFDIAYRVFQEGMFTVKGVPVETVPGGVLGVLLSVESSVEDPTRKLDAISMNMAAVFDSLNFSRGVLTFGDLFLTMLGGFLIIAFRLAAPVMIALAIDRQLAQRVTYPYVWGAVVLTIIWPIVAILIKAIAYMGGNVAMALGDRQRFYQFDDRTMQIIHSGSQHPFYTAVFAAAIMLIAGLCLWAAPYLAYQLSMGRVYEGVSTTISSWVGQVIGAGLEYYSAATAARITRQAEALQAEGGYSAEIIRAGAAKESEDLRARASKIIGVTGAQGSLRSQLAGIEGGRVQQIMGFGAEKQFGLKGLEAQTDLEKSNIWTRKDLSVADLQAMQAREGKNIEIDRHNAQLELWGRKINEGARFASGIARAVGDGVGDAIAPRSPQYGMLARGGGRVVGGGIEIIGSGADLYLQRRAIENRAAGRTDALNAYTDQAIRNQGAAAGRFDRAQDLYRERMKTATLDRAVDLTRAADAGAAISSAGARRGYGLTVGGYNTAYGLNLQANEKIYRGSLDAAKSVRDAALEAARLRAVASIVNAVGHNVARDIEQGLTLRY